MDILKDVLVAIGGGTVALIGVLTIFKNLFLKVMEKGIDITFDKKIEKYKNVLTRTTTAYEILLNKELDFYAKVDPLYAELVVLVQDLVYYSNYENDIDEIRRKEQYKKHVIRYLELIKEIKNESLIYQSYIPSKIFNATTEIIKTMQNDMAHWCEIAKIMYDESDGINDIKKSEEFCQNTLMLIAMCETFTKNRLKELSTVQ